MANIIPVILSGGSGSRLWPASRTLHPKQFLRLLSDHSLLQDTLLRVRNIANSLPPIIVSNKDHRFFVAEQLRELNTENAQIILEPCARNTAPAIALAALQVLESGDGIMLVLPADHIIEDQAQFERVVELGSKHCEQGKLVTFGIVPHKAETGYGYIQSGAELEQDVYEVARFIEKPNAEKATELVKDSSYSWNSGMFMFKASDYLNELKRTQAEMVELCKQAMQAAETDLDFIRAGEQAFAQTESISIDYAVMEHTNNAVVIPAKLGWNDIGSWSALWEARSKDANGNVIEGDVIAKDVSNSFLHSDKKLIAALGVDDVVLVESDDAILLAHKDHVQDVKTIVEQLKQSQRSEVEVHRKVYRPWGFYDGLDNGDRFQVKRLVLNPGAEISLQMHHHRAEHWVVVNGTAKVVNNGKESLLRVNESTYIPIGVTHKLSNPGTLPLELIEVQSGDYLGEDDIVRFDMDYEKHDPSL